MYHGVWLILYTVTSLSERLRSRRRPAPFLVTQYRCLYYFSKQELYFELNYKCKFSTV